MALLHRIVSHYFPKALERRSWQCAHPASTAIILYHEVLPDAIARPYWHVVSESQFRAQIRYFREHYDVLSLDEALSANEGSSTSNGRPRITITFDDGYAGNFQTALPILREFDMPFTVYVATSKVQNGGLYWYDVVIDALFERGSTELEVETSSGPIKYRKKEWLDSRQWATVNGVLEKLKRLPADERDQVADRLHLTTKSPTLSMMTPEETGRLASEPLATVGCHTHNHDLLDTIPVSDARDSIEQAQQLLKQWCGYRPTHFAYPNGNYSDDIVNLIRDLGFLSAVTTEDRLFCPDDDRHLIPRIAVGKFDTLNLIRAKIAGVFADPAGSKS